MLSAFDVIYTEMCVDLVGDQQTSVTLYLVFNLKNIYWKITIREIFSKNSMGRFSDVMICYYYCIASEQHRSELYNYIGWQQNSPMFQAPFQMDLNILIVLVNGIPKYLIWFNCGYQEINRFLGRVRFTCLCNPSTKDSVLLIQLRNAIIRVYIVWTPTNILHYLKKCVLMEQEIHSCYYIN